MMTGARVFFKADGRRPGYAEDGEKGGASYGKVNLTRLGGPWICGGCSQPRDGQVIPWRSTTLKAARAVRVGTAAGVGAGRRWLLALAGVVSAPARTCGAEVETLAALGVRREAKWETVRAGASGSDADLVASMSQMSGVEDRDEDEEACGMALGTTISGRRWEEACDLALGTTISGRWWEEACVMALIPTISGRGLLVEEDAVMLGSGLRARDTSLRRASNRARTPLPEGALDFNGEAGRPRRASNRARTSLAEAGALDLTGEALSGPRRAARRARSAWVDAEYIASGNWW